MANERTFLAWLRTSLSFITIGIGVTQILRLQNQGPKDGADPSAVFLASVDSAYMKEFGKTLGALFVLLGIVTLIFGALRFYKVQGLLIKDYYPATRLSILFLILAVLVMVTMTFIIVLRLVLS